MPNKLSQSNSPYLLQHQNNPVDWYPWGEEALSRAKAENKPIFLSIGYAACHWCHVMAHESFEDKATAAIMNEHFINIKVDREERPDIDGIYMDAVVSMTGSGGWPMSVFLTPDGKPFLGGTYFPPEPKHNLPSFSQLLNHVIRIWKEERAKLDDVSEQLTKRLQPELSIPEESVELKEALLANSVKMLGQNYDWQNGGWGKAPKFPQPMVIDYLLAQASIGNKDAEEMALHALRSMSKGGMYDVIGGGFARYSVDDYWLVPHFEKMLYDNAQLTRNYLHAFLITEDEQFKNICTESLDFIVRELRSKEGAFFSSLDADSEGEEGKFYVWSYGEIKAIISKSKDFELFSSAYGLREKGNFEGQIILQDHQSDLELSDSFKLPIKDVSLNLLKSRKLLLDARARRIRPQTDDKAITSWNAIMLQSFSEAARYLKRDDYLQVAIENANFIIDNLFVEGRLLRSWRKGQADHLAFLEDYGALILAMLSLYESDPNSKWFQFADQLTNEMLRLFIEDDLLYDTGIDHEKLLIRPRDLQDNASPAGNSLATFALLKMYAYTAKQQYYEIAMRNLGSMQNMISQYPTSFGQWLQALDFSMADGYEIAIVGQRDAEDTERLRDVIWARYRPYEIIAQSSPEKNEQGAPLLLDRAMIDNKASVYVCQHFVCQLPVNSPTNLAKLLN